MSARAVRHGVCLLLLYAVAAERERRGLGAIDVITVGLVGGEAGDAAGKLSSTMLRALRAKANAQ
jgi:phosphopantetheine adenylyltransferase